jgi:TonB family protein
MKKMLLMAFVALMSMSVNAQNDPICQTPEVFPEFKGGVSAMMKFICDNVKYPKDAEESKTEGRVVVQLTIEKDGKVSGYKVVNKVSPSLDDEALRVAKLTSDKWIPAKNKGKAVRTNYTIPIQFRLN